MNTQGIQDIPTPKFKSRHFLLPDELTPGLSPVSFPKTLRSLTPNMQIQFCRLSVLNSSPNPDLPTLS